MLDQYPRISALLLADVLESLPARLRKKIDLNEAPDATDPGALSADGSSFVVKQASGTVTFTADPLTSIDQLSCDCLLSPRCLHLAHAALRCQVADVSPAADSNPSDSDIDTEDGGTENVGTDEARIEDSNAENASADSKNPSGYSGLSKSQEALVERALSSCTQLLANGTKLRDPLQLSAFLRLAHEGKALKLYSLGEFSAALTQLLISSENFSRAALVAATSDLFLCAHQLRHGHKQGSLSKEQFGTPRRSYASRPALKLQGLFTEPIIAGSGYAGVATYLREADGTLWSINSNMPQEAETSPKAQSRQYYHRAPRIGGISTSHFELTRRNLLVNNVKASENGRLGAGAGVSAVASSVAAWDPAWFETNDAGNGAVTLQRLTVVGMRGKSLVLAASAANIAVNATDAALVLGALDTLLELARHPGLTLDCVLRKELEATHLLAFAPDPELVSLPENLHGRIMLGLDLLPASFFKELGTAIALASEVSLGPAQVMSAWLGKLVTYGRPAVTSDSTMLGRDVTKLRESQCVHGAELLERLAAAAKEAEREFDGSLRYLDPPLAQAWLRLAAYSKHWLASAT